MRRALAESAGAQPLSTPNPPVGAVIVDRSGAVVGVGHTQEAGGPHAEVVALAAAGDHAAGGTAYVTLEPCNHTGRTGPCAQALIAAGIAAVHYAMADPNPSAAGGAATLRAAGVEVTAGLLADEVAAGPLRAWLHRQRTGRPFVTAKFAATLDGRSAAPDGTSQWITGPQAREYVHAERARLDAIVVGTGTVLADDPALTARHPDGSLHPRQPLRVVVGERDIPETARVLDDCAPTLILRTRDLSAVLDEIGDRSNVQVEGGPRLLGAFAAAGLVDRVQAYLAPALLGGGTAAVVDPTVRTLTEIHRFRRESVVELGEDLLVTLVPVAGRVDPTQV
ncbi:bifunctional diaminohydroxyphosphoribosylaminopyrimidine deaminase/5-amino-6-(5-phosphoribosylamino)uracil reductase RibD [Jongsikchunia kroppenstedtii]|uniref:bifunctional diaminohydroxyphosphoribosylaminopyrimidine deaminase/5-amino-6-(5-phosphoribosylamino)uracil reductase RibD n=1 Tax=Jongsikchunia kroppenstedtii TaxID=1121721 RepID=UPI00036F1F50